jgi:hypothetical protein
VSRSIPSAVFWSIRSSPVSSATDRGSRPVTSRCGDLQMQRRQPRPPDAATRDAATATPYAAPRPLDAAATTSGCGNPDLQMQRLRAPVASFPVEGRSRAEWSLPVEGRGAVRRPCACSADERGGGSGGGGGQERRKMGEMREREGCGWGFGGATGPATVLCGDEFSLGDLRSSI